MDNMFSYVEKAASTSLCALDGQGCSDPKTYIAKWNCKRRRTPRWPALDKMLARRSKLTSDSLSWMKARRKLLDQMHWAAVRPQRFRRASLFLCHGPRLARWPIGRR